MRPNLLRLQPVYCDADRYDVTLDFTRDQPTLDVTGSTSSLHLVRCKRHLTPTYTTLRKSRVVSIHTQIIHPIAVAAIWGPRG